MSYQKKVLGKRTAMGEFTNQNRGGKGVKCYKITEKTGNVIGMKAVNEDDDHDDQQRGNHYPYGVRYDFQTWKNYVRREADQPEKMRP